MAFWGVEVKPGKVCPFVPPPEGSKLHLSQASLGVAASKGARCVLRVKVGDGEPLVVCCLREGGTESTGLDLIFDSYAEFSVEGPAAVHLTGYYMPEYELDDAHDYEDDSDDDDGQQPQILGYDEYGVPVLSSEYESEDDSDYISEEGGSGDEDEEGSEDDSEDDDDDGIQQLGRGRRVVIEEINDEEPAGAVKPGALKALPAPETANGKAAQFGDDDVSASDDEDEEDSEDDEEESSEEEEEVEQVPQQAQQHAGQKRKSEAAPTPAKKQAVEDGKGGKQGKPAAAGAAQTPKPQQGKQQAKEQQQMEKSAAKQQQKEAGQPQQQQPKSAAKQHQQQAKTPAKEEPVAAGEVPSSNKKVRRFANGFEIEELKQGRPDSKLAKPGKKVVVRYVGKLKSTGKIFDQTQGNRTFTFRLGVGEVIKGWDKGVENMRVGDKRRLTIPPQMAYGTQGVRGAIPSNAWLNFDVELVDVKG